MLPKFHVAYDRSALPVIRRTVNGEDVSRRGAFSFGTLLTLHLRVPRRLGSAAVVLRIRRDGGDPHDFPLLFQSTDYITDEYTIPIDTAEFCGEAEHGLFYYTFLFVRGADTLFTDSINNVDFRLTGQEGGARPFRLLVYDRNYTSPAWFPGGVMYHIFVDRFCRGAGPVRLREDAVRNDDWDHGIPQYPPYPGAPLANNEFFGGNLWGVAEKLELLAGRGVTVLYLSPVFEAASNHKYDTGDYEKVDDAFGSEAALSHLLSEADRHGIRIILDGVFNHTGDDSRYFNRYGRYPGIGAWQSPESPYFSWYTFTHYPDQYDCWWGIPILPRLNGENPDTVRYLAGKDGIAAGRVRQGIAGWRLDVADELTEPFLEELRQSVHAAGKKEQPILIGEVWENAADKVAYGHRRHYFSGRQLDSVMNYPLRNALISFVRDRNADPLYHTLTELYSSYPRPMCDCLMNFLGTHDTPRILTLLGTSEPDAVRTNEECAHASLSPGERELALRRLCQALTLLYTVYGVPSVFYGDEAGLEGYHDPFCRRPYPWGREEPALIRTFSFLGALRKEHACYARGDFRILSHDAHTLIFERSTPDCRILTVANLGSSPLRLTDRGPWERLTPDGPVLFSTADTAAQSPSVPTGGETAVCQGEPAVPPDCVWLLRDISRRGTSAT